MKRNVLLGFAVFVVGALLGCSSGDTSIDLRGNWEFVYSQGYSSKPMPWKIDQTGKTITITSLLPGVDIVFTGPYYPESATFEATFPAGEQIYTGKAATNGDLIDGIWTNKRNLPATTGTFVGRRTR